MKAVARTAQFKRDVKRMLKRGQNFAEFKTVLHHLVQGDPLDLHYRDHILIGQYKGFRECHLEPDWLLIYEATDEEITLVRMGSHSDLFK